MPTLYASLYRVKRSPRNITEREYPQKQNNVVEKSFPVPATKKRLDCHLVSDFFHPQQTKQSERSETLVQFFL